MVLGPFALDIFGIITAKTLPVVLDFLTNKLKKVLDGKPSEGNREIEALRKEVDVLRTQLEEKEAVGTSEIKQVEKQIQKARLLQQKYGLELISDQAHKRWILEQFEELGKTKNFKSTFKIEVWTQQGALSTSRDIVILPSSSYKIGNKIVFFFRSTHDCYLTLFNLGTSGAITVLFPNRLFQDNFIKAKETYTIPGKGYPFEYELQGPKGTEKVVLIATTRKVEILDLEFKGGTDVFYSVDRSAAARDIKIVERRVRELPEVTWATATCEFVVE